MSLLTNRSMNKKETKKNFSHPLESNEKRKKTSSNKTKKNTIKFSVQQRKTKIDIFRQFDIWCCRKCRRKLAMKCCSIKARSQFENIIEVSKFYRGNTIQKIKDFFQLETKLSLSLSLSLSHSLTLCLHLL